MNYTIITDKELLIDFIDNFLPDLKEDETFYFSLFSRSKYCKNEEGTNLVPHIKSDKAQIHRGTSNKERLYDKIKQLEVEVGSYRTKHGLEIPQISLAVYINPNPRCQQKALLNCMKRYCEILSCKGTGFNISSEALSSIQRSCSRKIYFDMDIDIPQGDEVIYENLIKVLESFINKSAMNFLITRGGYHLLIELSKIEEQFKKTWYNNLVSILEPDNTGDMMCPIPGCFSGNFTPYFLNLEEL